jgi:hypothetical protein
VDAGFPSKTRQNKNLDQAKFGPSFARLLRETQQWRAIMEQIRPDFAPLRNMDGFKRLSLSVIATELRPRLRRGRLGGVLSLSLIMATFFYFLF